MINLVLYIQIVKFIVLYYHVTTLAKSKIAIDFICIEQCHVLESNTSCYEIELRDNYRVSLAEKSLSFTSFFGYWAGIKM